MSNNSINLQQAPYLLEQRQFPGSNVGALAAQMDLAYIDIAQKVNAREIGLYALGYPTITGEAWFFRGPSYRQQGVRQIFQFTGAGPIIHNLDFAGINRFVHGYGSYTDGTNWYGVVFGTSVALAGQVTFWVDPVNINVIVGGGAPAVTSGIVVIEWISNTNSP